MGQIYNVSCSKCGFRTELALGGGLNSIKLAVLLNTVSDSDRAQIEKLQSSDSIASAAGEYRAARCLNCTEAPALQAKSIVTVTDKSGNIHVFGDKCEYCAGQLTVFDCTPQSLRFISCPKCGNSALCFEIAGHWD